MALLMTSSSFLGGTVGARPRVSLASRAVRKCQPAPRTPGLVVSAGCLRSAMGASIKSVVAVGTSIALASAPVLAIGPEMFNIVSGYPCDGEPRGCQSRRTLDYTDDPYTKNINSMVIADDVRDNTERSLQPG
eukprot:2898592-Pyramimonas_sp.AAC.1